MIDPTEALTAIDVNSGRSKKGASQEETAVGTNVEAAAEVGRQLRLRDIGGLIVVDFIDMRSPRNRRKVEKAMKDAMKPDKARFTVSRISANGLLEINRQRIHQALQMRTHGDCTNCGGTGRVASPDLIALRLLRNIESHGAAGYMRGVRIAMQPELADFLQNRHREALVKLGQEFELEIEISAQPHLHGQEPEINWLARDLADVKKREREEAKEKKLEQEMLATPSIGDTEGEPEDEPAAVEEAAPEAAPKKRRRRGGRRRRSKATRKTKAKAKAKPKEKAPAAEGPATGGNGARSTDDGAGTDAIKVPGIDSPGAAKGAQGNKAGAAPSGNGAPRPSRRRRRRRRPRRSKAPEGGGGDKPQPAETGTN